MMKAIMLGDIQIGTAVKTVFALILLSGNAGCAGVGMAVLGNHEESFANPGISTDKKGIDSIEGREPRIKSEDLLNYWGAPDKLEQPETGGQLWRYNFGLRWNGIGLMLVIVPVPIFVPVGYEYIEFRIENDWVVGARTREDTFIAEYGCFASAIMHAQGSECRFGKDPFAENRSQTFIKHETTYRIRVVNRSEDPLAISFARRNNENRLVEEHFTLNPHQSRHLLAAGHGEALRVISPDGRKIVHLPREEALNKIYDKDSSLFYLIDKEVIIPVPVKDWETWENSLERLFRESHSK